MRSNALAEPVITSDTTGFTVSLYNKSLYDPKVKLWLSKFDKFKLTQNQIAVLALGFGGKEFSTQDIIDRLGIVNFDDIREIMTPPRQWGLIERTRNHYQAMKFSTQNRIPKREVPTYKVVDAEEVSKRTAARPPVQVTVSNTELPEDEIQGNAKLFLSNLDYAVTKEELLALLSSQCDVLEISIPRGLQSGSNKGYAFVVVNSTSPIPELISKLDGIEIRHRRLRVSLSRT